MKTYTKKPDSVTAIQWNGKNTDEVVEFASYIQEPDVKVQPVQVDSMVPGKLSVQTRTGYVHANEGDFIVKDSLNNITVLPEDEFNNQYEVSKTKKESSSVDSKPTATKKK